MMRDRALLANARRPGTLRVLSGQDSIAEQQPTQNPGAPAGDNPGLDQGQIVTPSSSFTPDPRPSAAVSASGRWTRDIVHGYHRFGGDHPTRPITVIFTIPEDSLPSL
jgi:hypothetical protein